MKPIDFKEKTKVLVKPRSMTDKECGSLAIWNEDKEVCISCWKGTLKDKLRFLFTGKIWLHVWFGETQPPVCVETKFPFGEKK